jgi:membrane protease YdiL (CAAX protease family)
LGIGYSLVIRFSVGVVAFVFILFLLGAKVLTPDSLREFLSANRPDVEALVDVSALRNNPAYFWLIVTLGSFVAAGLREEIWRAGTLAAMRALWPNTFGRRNGEFVAVALIAIVFGVVHLGMGALAAGMAGLLGLLLGVIMVVHRSIWPAVIAHGLFDATTFALLRWTFEHLQHLR